MEENNGDETSVEETIGGESGLTRRTRGGYLVLASCCVIGGVSVWNVLLQAIAMGQGTWVGVAREIGHTATHSLGSLLCLWLAWRPVSWLSSEKLCVVLLIVANAFLPTFSQIFTMFYSTTALYSTSSIDFLFPMFMMSFGLLVLLICGYQFFGRFAGLQLVSRNENPSRKRLTIRSFFLLTSCFAIPLAIDIWMRRNQSPDYALGNVTTFYLLWLGSIASDVVIHGLVAMMFCLRRSKLPYVIFGLFFAVVLKGGSHWISFNEMMTRNDMLSSNVTSAFREMMIGQFVMLGGELIFIPLGFSVIRSAGYVLRIVDSRDVGGGEVDEEHPLG